MFGISQQESHENLMLYFAMKENLYKVEALFSEDSARGQVGGREGNIQGSQKPTHKNSRVVHAGAVCATQTTGWSAAAAPRCSQAPR